MLKIKGVKIMWPFKRKNETEKREFVKNVIKAGKLDPSKEEKAVKELLDCDIIIKRM